MDHRISYRLVVTCLAGVVLLVGLSGAAAAQSVPDDVPDVTIELGDEEISTANDTNRSDDGSGGGAVPPEDDSSDDGSQFLSLNSGVELAGYGGGIQIDCTGDPIDGHVCDKGGSLEAGPVNVYYDGIMGGPISEFEYWFDDDIDVEVAGENGTVDFDCYEMSFDNLHCAVDGERTDGEQADGERADRERTDGGDDGERADDGDDDRLSGLLGLF